MSKKRSRRVATLLSVAALAIAAVPAAAMGASTTVTPAGDSFALGSSTINIDITSVGMGGQCTISGGTGVIPASPKNHNSSGPVTVNLTARPKITSCELGAIGGPYEWVGALSVDTRGTWSVSFQGGSPTTAAVNIPSEGLTLNYWGSCSAEIPFAKTLTLGAGWTNGTASPLVSSKLGLNPTVYQPKWYGTYCPYGELDPIEIHNATIPVTDTTNGAKVIQVGL